MAISERDRGKPNLCRNRAQQHQTYLTRHMAAQPPAGKAEDVVGDVLGLGKLLERRRRERRVDDVRVGQLGSDRNRPCPSRVDDVDPALGRDLHELIFKALLEPVEAGLGRGVVRMHGLAKEAGGRADEDDGDPVPVLLGDVLELIEEAFGEYERSWGAQTEWERTSDDGGQRAVDETEQKRRRSGKRR
jgi:hypothetical protein